MSELAIIDSCDTSGNAHVDNDDDDDDETEGADEVNDTDHDEEVGVEQVDHDNADAESLDPRIQVSSHKCTSLMICEKLLRILFLHKSGFK